MALKGWVVNRESGISGILAVVVLLFGTLGVTVAGTEPAAAATCAGVTPDYNGDGIVDTVVTDPQATVNGASQAGLVRVLYGGDKGVSEISQATTGMKAVPEPGDQFGTAVARADFNGDGCTDLVIGTPYEDVTVSGADVKDAGCLHVIYGSPSGIGEGSVIEGYTQSAFTPGADNEAGDHFGYALQASAANTGKPYLVVGVPGEDVVVDGVDLADAGAIIYQQGSDRITVTQKSPGVPGVVEAGDQFGASLAGTSRYFAVGVPGETIGTDAVAAGAVTVFNHTLTDGYPTAIASMGQDSAGMAGVAEAGDRFGAALSMTGYRPSTETYNSDALLAIGIPGEDIGDVPDAGGATVMRIEPSGSFTQLKAFDAGTADVEGDPEAGDFMGQRVAITNTDTSVVTSTATVRLAVGIPGRDVGGVEDAGVIHVFNPLDSHIGTADKIIERGSSILPGTPNARDLTGMSLRSGATTLYIGIPYSKDPGTSKGVLYTMPWSDIDGTTTSGTKTFQPGAGGISDIGASFAAVG
ncbi:FG-GAP repeat protein [Streptomyces sp. NPDC052052]|uniref:FG-GAP and VCBS repeat-containing protein n=1 Tax=Streptomyces sp. NPDC052052 TaxID=3154756 RepID=UPI0034155255